MSRAFITDKEDWNYCPKSGDRCMYAEVGRACRKKDCEFFDREGKAAGKPAKGLRVVTREAERVPASTKEKDEPQVRKTKKASLPMPRKWGGRSGSSFN